MNLKRKIIFLSSVGLAFWSPSSTVAMATEAFSGSSPKAASKSTSDPQAEIVVTALKRSESVQNTPATVSIVNSAAIARAGIATVEQLGQVVPGLIMQRPPNNTANASIRGIGTSPGPLSFEQSVGLFVDGVYSGRGADFLASLFDLDRIEVVKGTQAAVLGKNTSLGAITLNTRKPGDTFEIDAIGSYDLSRDSRMVSGGVDVPLGAELSVRLAGQYQNLGGFMVNQVNNGVAEDRARLTKEAAGRATLVWKSVAGLTVTANYSHEYLRNYGNVAEFIVGSPVAAAAFAAAGASALYETNQDFHYAVNGVAGGPTRLSQKSDRATLMLDYDLSGAILAAITGWSRFDQHRHIDYDYTPGDYLEDDTEIKGSQISQELRLTSTGSSSFQYLIGGLYAHNKLFQDIFQDADYPVNPKGTYHGTFNQITDTWSAFAQPSYALTDTLKLVGGIRVTGEKKTVNMERVRLVTGLYTTLIYPPYPMTRLKRSETIVDGSVSAQYKPMSGLMLYGSWGQGTKGGGFSDFAVPATSKYAKEVARTIEAGVKFEDASRTWHINAAYFHTRVQNFQNNTFNGTNFIVQNVHVASDGLELDTAWEPAHKLRFALEGTYAKTRNLDAAPGTSDRFPRSPRLSGKIAASYAPDLTDRFSLNLGADITYRSLMTHQLASAPVAPAFTTINGIIGLRDRVSGIEISLIGRNLNNGRSYSFTFPAPSLPGASIGTPEEPRSVMVQLKFTY